MNHSEPLINNEILTQWQKITNLIARIAGIRVALIMKVVDREIEVFVSSQTENNPDLKYNLVCYLGFPIRYSNGRIFGTFCLLHNLEHKYSLEEIELVEKMRDLVERDVQLTEKLTLQQLLTHRSPLHRLLDHLPIPLSCITFAIDYPVVYINHEFSRQFGYTLQDIPTVDDWMILAYPDPKYRTKVCQSWKKTVQEIQSDQGKVEPKKYDVTCKDGTVLTVMISVSVVENLLLVSFVVL
jgi:PAS domain-containing protein